MNSIVRIKNLDVNQITYSEPKVNNFGGKNVYINYIGEKQSLILQIPKMRMPYDMNEYKPDNGSTDVDSKYSISLSFNNMETDPKVKEFYDKLKSLDKKLISMGVKNSKTWFKKNHSKDVIKAFYSPIIKVYKDKETGEESDKYAPTIKLKIPRRDNKFSCEVYNDKKERVELVDVVGKGAQVQAIIKCNGIWFAGSRYGVSWRIEQMKVTPSKKLQGYCFIEESDEDDDVPNSDDEIDNVSVESSSSEDSDSD